MVQYWLLPRENCESKDLPKAPCSVKIRQTGIKTRKNCRNYAEWAFKNTTHVFILQLHSVFLGKSVFKLEKDGISVNALKSSGGILQKVFLKIIATLFKNIPLQVLP